MKIERARTATDHLAIDDAADDELRGHVSEDENVELRCCSARSIEAPSLSRCD
jgi:hypothetical protein